MGKNIFKENLWFIHVLAFIFGGTVGYLIWAFSDKLTGQVEPWDSPLVYFGFLMGVSFFCSFFGWKIFSIYACGLWIGQVAFMNAVYLPSVSGPVIFPPWFGVLFHCLAPCLMGAFAGKACFWLLGKRKDERKRKKL